MQSTLRASRRFLAAQRRRFLRWRQHPFGLPIMSFIAAVVVGGVLLLVLSATHTTTTFHPYTSYIVIIKHDGITQTVPTKEPTVGALLQKLDIPVGAHDRVEPALDTAIVQDNFRINIYRAVPVTITDGTSTYTTYSAAATPRAAVTEAGIKLYSEDEVIDQPASNLVQQDSLGSYITINRAVPVTLIVYGAILPLRTHETTIGDLLKARGVKLHPQDTLTPSVNTPITPNIQIAVNRKGTQIVTQTQAVPEPVQTVTDNSLSFGTTAVRQQGVPGTEVLTYQENTLNGKVVSQTLLQTVITVQPVTEVVAQGQAVTIPADKEAVMAEAGISTDDYKYVDYIASHEGGWCPTKIQGSHTCPAYMDPSDVPSYGGYGIFQATPGSKMASAGSDWATDVVTQLRWGTGYADGRYGSWENAYDHWSTYHNW
ncbi:MAG TPA: ubiquitin-like domain-containing protein [Verrucomicrobiae bacterium]|nr:ubiquitin-like domain-containing protein [Verrucomicrobiae bacterium]